MLLLGAGGIWVGIIGEIWNHRNKVIFKNGCVDLIEFFYCGTKEYLVLDYGKEKIGWFLLLRLGPFCCMMFGDLCLTFCPGLAIVSSW